MAEKMTEKAKKFLNGTVAVLVRNKEEFDRLAAFCAKHLPIDARTGFSRFHGYGFDVLSAGFNPKEFCVKFYPKTSAHDVHHFGIDDPRCVRHAYGVVSIDDFFEFAPMSVTKIDAIKGTSSYYVLVRRNGERLTLSEDEYWMIVSDGNFRATRADILEHLECFTDEETPVKYSDEEIDEATSRLMRYRANDDADNAYANITEALSLSRKTAE